MNPGQGIGELVSGLRVAAAEVVGQAGKTCDGDRRNAAETRIRLGNARDDTRRFEIVMLR